MNQLIYSTCFPPAPLVEMHSLWDLSCPAREHTQGPGGESAKS